MHKKYLLFIALFAALACAVVLFFVVLSRHTPPERPTRTAEALAQSCAECHQAAFEDWRQSQHARANQTVDPERLARLPDKPAFPKSPTMQIGLDPLIQYVIAMDKGRFQVFDQAYDPKAKDWFNVFAGDERHAGEWGHWQGRGMNWNSQCAVCHMTGYDKGYDRKTDTYHSTWKAMGISCIQCHSTMPEHPQQLSPAQIEASCASCHARREELHGGFAAGDKFDDFFRLMLPDQTDLFYPDGQAKAEIFEYNSFQLSRMAHAGVNCLDCHNPHSGKLKLPTADNTLCLSCHQAPGRRGAIPIDPVAHSHHAADSPGNQCINCHMPAHPYMVRDRRRDHRLGIPDPLMTKEWGIPNACNACHADRSTAWAIQKTQAWYGNKMDRPSRQRTRALARAQAGDTSAGTDLLHLARDEENPAWRATLIAHLSLWLGLPDVHDFVLQALQDPSPWVRSAAIQALQYTPDALPAVAKLSQDPTRLVRIDAAWARAIHGQLAPTEKAELLAYLNEHADQPTGAIKWAQLDLAEQKIPDAIQWLQKAIAWDPGSAYPQYLMGRALYAIQRLKEARPYFEMACQFEPGNAEYVYNLALLLDEMGDVQGAQTQLEKTVALNPQFGRAWFNLGVVYFRAEQLEKAMAALERAERLLPLSPDPPQVLADIYRRVGRQQEAAEQRRKAMRLQKTP